MNRKPLFITLAVALAVISIVAIVLFVKNKPVNPKEKTGKRNTDKLEPEEAEIIPEEEVKPAIIEP
jgi:hypothetical protein